MAELKKYKYKSCEYTFLDNALTPYWEGAVKWVPLWVAPNLITFVGWLLIIVSYVNILRYDYTLQKDVPNYCFILTAFCVWAYSTLDAIDGIQTVKSINIVNKIDSTLGYSDYSYDISAATANNVIYPSLNPMIFELKYPDSDIQGKVVPL